MFTFYIENHETFGSLQARRKQFCSGAATGNQKTAGGLGPGQSPGGVQRQSPGGVQRQSPGKLQEFCVSVTLKQHFPETIFGFISNKDFLKY